MSGISLNMYLSKIANAWDAGEGEDLAALLSFRDGHVANARLQVAEPEAQVERVLDPPLDEMVAAHVRGCWAWSESDMLEAYKCQTMVVSSFAKLLGTNISLIHQFISVCSSVRIPEGRELVAASDVRGLSGSQTVRSSGGQTEEIPGPWEAWGDAGEGKRGHHGLLQGLRG